MIAMHSTLTDGTLQANVLRALQGRLGADASDIGVDVVHQIVTLVGSTPTMQERCMAESIVERVPGVRAVANDIALAPDDWPADSTIAEVAVEALSDELGSDGDNVMIVVRGGRLTLTGSVPSELVRTAAERAVHLLPGIRDVSNALFIAPLA